jgi:uncharacterized protein YndB with AHSA1/START domain
MALPIREGDIPGIQLRARRRLEVDGAEAWRWLTERERLERWLADRVEVDAGPRGGWRLQSDSPAGTVIETATTERIDPARAWVLSFRRDDPRWEAPTRLELTLLPAGPACDVDVLQAGFHLLAMSWCLTIWEEYRRRWRDALERLAAAASGSGAAA